MHAIKCSKTCKRCVSDLVGQKIRIENVLAKIFEQIEKLIKRDWQYLELKKFEKRACKTVYLLVLKLARKMSISKSVVCFGSQKSRVYNNMIGLLGFTILCAAKLFSRGLLQLSNLR